MTAACDPAGSFRNHAAPGSVDAAQDEKASFAMTMQQTGSPRQDHDLEEAGGMLAAAMTGARLGIVISDAGQPGHPAVFVNEAFLALTGRVRDEVLGRDVRELLDLESGADDLAQALESGAGGTLDLLCRRHDGARFWDRLDLSPIRRADGTVCGFLGTHTDVTCERLAEHAHARELELALQQRTALLHEVDHRVKNNLQLISSLLMLQSRRITSLDTREVLRSMLERVNAVATVHRRLFKSEDLERFDVAAFVRDLVADLAGSAGRDGVALRLDLEPVAVPASQAAPLALVLNELVGNALKHAFPEGRQGAVDVALVRTPRGFEIVVADDGVGACDAPKGFGSTIVQLLGKQLRAEIDVQATQPGQRVVVRVPLDPVT
jgi:PAS domain S-box-containing protein